ncbi:beta-lactamase family protein [Flavihumibacter sp. R14]|nr:beta-lactamase family protein [Flavihumibacter soli]
MKGKLILAFALLLSVMFNSSSQVNGKLPDDQTIRKWMAEYKTPSVAIGTIEDGRVKDLKIVSDKSGTQPLNTVFNVASLTKPVTALTVLRLVTLGSWDLDEPLYHYWTDPDVKNDPRHKLLTSRNILSQKSGFPNWRWMDESKVLKFQFSPGERFGYSGEGYEYLRHALETKFKMSLDRLADSVLFRPYNLKETKFFWDQTIRPERFAVGHDTTGKPYEIYKNREANAANWLMTTIEDYTRFAAEVINGGQLSPGVFEQMVSPQTTLNQNKQVYWGLGWAVIKGLKNEEYALMHGGGGQGVACNVVLLPGSKRGLVVLTNGDRGSEICNKILMEYLGCGEEILSRVR